MLQSLLRNHVPANLTFLLVLVLGVLSYLTMPRARDPDINFNWINIMTVLPGASAVEVEKRVTDPIEDAISRSVRDLRFVSSTSREGISTILVRFQQLSERDFDKRLADLRREVQNVYTDQLPEEAQDPSIYEITTSNGFPTASVVLTAAAADEDMRRYAVFIKKELERLPGVDQTLMEGAEQPELHIAFYPERLVGLGITPADLADTVRGYFRDVSVGDIETAKGKWVVRLKGTSGSPADLESFPVVSARGVVELGSLADIYRTSEEAARLVHYQGKPAVLFTVTKQEGTNTLELLEGLQQFIEERNETALGMELVLVDDQTVSTREALSLMQTNALIGLVLVVLVAWLFLGTRIAFLTGIGIPFTLAGTFLVLNTMGMTLNNSVLLGVVIALGMLVDDAVVVVESIYYRLQRGMRTFEAGLEALREVAAPVTTSVMTTMAAFLPLMLLPGILGEFMRVIPLTVAVALAISLIEAFWMLPTHISVIRVDFSRQSRIQRHREQLTRRVRSQYSRALILALRYPWRAFGIVAAIFVAALILVGAGAIRFNFFAADAFRIFYVSVEMPQGTNLRNTRDEVLEIERQARAVILPEELRATVSYAGQMMTQTEPLFGDNIGQVMVSLEPQQTGGRHVDEVAKAVEAVFADWSSTPSHRGKVTLLQVKEGPPLGRAINVKVRGDEFATLQLAVDDLIGFMESQDGLYHNITQDFRLGSQELLLSLNGDAIQRAGLRPETVTRTLQAYADGELISQFQDNGEEVNVRVIAQGDDAGMIDDLLRQTISRPDGQATAIGDLVEAKFGYGQQNIRHYNFRRTITIESDIAKERIDTVKANAMLQDYWRSVADRYPRVSLEFSGELDDIQESMDSIGLLFIMGIGLIYLILGTQFGSYWQPLLVLVAVPLAFTGVVLGLAVTGNPLSLYTLYGVVALSGISVNAAIVLISAANDRRRRGMSILHATVYAARRRVVPILITSFTTIAGLFSLAVGLGGKSLVWGPVATTIVSGLISSTALTLFVVPLLYRAAMSHSEKAGGGFLEGFYKTVRLRLRKVTNQS